MSRLFKFDEASGTLVLRDLGQPFSHESVAAFVKSYLFMGRQKTNIA